MADALQKKSAIEDKLKKIEREAEERDAKRKASDAGLSYVDLKNIPVQIDALSLISKEDAIKNKMAVVAKKRNSVAVVVSDPKNQGTKKVTERLKSQGLKPEIMVGSLAGLRTIWRSYDFVKKELAEITGQVVIDSQRLKELRPKLVSIQSAKDEIVKILGSKLGVAPVLEILLAAALSLKGSDIHLEPGEKNIKFRLRIDGLLHDVFNEIATQDYFFLISRIKLLSSMKLNIHDAAQDGRFTINLGDKDIEIRSSVLPSEYGETAVLRILDPETIRLTLNDLGLRDDDLVIINEELGRPNGMLLNTGPTGSGKTTTLYAFIMQVNKPESKIITLEDPIEYRLEGIEQTQVDDEAGYTFGNGLRSIVRQDPDVILVGEIRDLETADIALNAALTGHLVFSTLHTNDSFGAIPRLLDLGVKTAIIGPALNLIIAQRLVRRLCDKCKAEDSSFGGLKKQVQSFLKNLPDKVSKSKYKDFIKGQGKIFKARGCTACGGIGYGGRIAIMELLRINDELSGLISKEVTESEIKKSAAKQGTVSIQGSGILKILEGVTTIEEVIRVTGPIVWQ
ncbi:MAG: type II/IV secretion system protein [Candidatus Liptonbacteria bacterium]|nr:type II/IV secretion system protein [Candidatus Liptonbacteria bacterium]